MAQKLICPNEWKQGFWIGFVSALFLAGIAFSVAAKINSY